MYWKQYGKCRAFALIVLCGDIAAVSFDYAFCDEESKPRPPLIFSCLCDKFVEQHREYFFGYTRSIVLYHDFYRSIVIVIGSLDLYRPILCKLGSIIDD